MAAVSIHVLMTGAGAPGGPGILKCLQKEPGVRVTVADAAADVAGRYLVEDFLQLPPGDDPRFAETVLNACRTRGIQIILPLVSRELIPLAQSRASFASAGIRIPLSATESLEIASNKSRLYEFLQWRGLPVPDFRVATSIGEWSQALKELGYPGKAVCFKPSISNGGRGFRVLDSGMDRRKLFFEQKPDHPFISIEEAQHILSAGPIPELLVSEYLSGQEYSVDCLADRGRTVIALPRLRIRIRGGITVQGQFVRHEEILAYCEAIIRELRLHGPIGIQVRANAEGRFRILEVNPRLQGTVSSALGAGINLPVLSLLQEFGLPIDPGSLRVRWGTRFLRYWEDVFY